MQNDKRQDARTSVLKKARIVFGNSDFTRSATDCVVVDLSPSGVRVRTGVSVTVPEWVTLIFSDGTTFRARRCWARGTEIGFELAAADDKSLLDAMISGLTHDQRRALVARIEASLISK